MPESIFKQVSLDILRLHQQTCHTLLATQSSDSTEIHEAVYVTLDGRYYVLLPQAPEAEALQSGILLIETDDAHARLSWVASARAVAQQPAALAIDFRDRPPIDGRPAGGEGQTFE